MALLIDGYNLLHVTDIVGTAGPNETVLHASREALLRFIAAALDAKTRRETTIVFDAAGAPPGLPQTTSHEGITVHFARKFADADEMLEHLIEEHTAPRSLIVISSDHRVQRAARRRGASYIDSDVWFTERKAQRRAAGKQAAEESSKPAGSLSPEQVEFWLSEFSEQSPGKSGKTKRHKEQ